MPRKTIALAVASAVVVASISASAASAKNEPPLQPGGPASIREAQGIADLDVWFISGLALAAIVAALLLADDDDETTTTETD